VAVKTERDELAPWSLNTRKSLNTVHLQTYDDVKIVQSGVGATFTDSLHIPKVKSVRAQKSQIILPSSNKITTNEPKPTEGSVPRINPALLKRKI
jgi:hypothetical protein